MRRRVMLTMLLALATLGIPSAGDLRAQSAPGGPTPGGHGHATSGHAGSGHGGHGAHGGDGPHHAAEACTKDFERVIVEGRGFGMAFAADQNGYPGPMHVLELATRLQLTQAQAERMKQLMHDMFAASKPKAAQLLDAERRLERLFADRRADEPTVRSAVAEVERLRGELRLVHLLTHLRTRAVLGDEQRRAYHDARWGPAAAR